MRSLCEKEKKEKRKKTMSAPTSETANDGPAQVVGEKEEGAVEGIRLCSNCGVLPVYSPKSNFCGRGCRRSLYDKGRRKRAKEIKENKCAELKEDTPEAPSPLSLKPVKATGRKKVKETLFGAETERICLKCGEPFNSVWKGNRLCPTCGKYAKSTSDYFDANSRY